MSDAPILTTCSSDQKSGINCGPPAASVRRNNKKRIGGIAQSEDGQHDKYLHQRAPAARSGIRDWGLGIRWLTRIQIGPAFVNPEQQHNRRQAWYRGQRKQRPIAIRKREEKSCRQQRAEHRAGVIHCAVEAVHLAAIRSVGEIGEHRVAWGAADALSHTIDESQREHCHQRPQC